MVWFFRLIRNENQYFESLIRMVYSDRWKANDLFEKLLESRNVVPAIRNFVWIICCCVIFAGKLLDSTLISSLIHQEEKVRKKLCSAVLFLSNSTAASSSSGLLIK